MYKFITTVWIMAGLFMGGTHVLHAYDIHHPDPMSILNGAHHRAPRQNVQPKRVENNATKGLQPSRMYKRRKESKYVIKPEPYSIASQKSDPELLGPQRTLTTTPTAAATPASATPDAPVSPAVPSATSVPAAKSPSGGVTREECIGWIGQERFDAYVAKYGGEQGALRRCLILKRTRG